MVRLSASPRMLALWTLVWMLKQQPPLQAASFCPVTTTSLSLTVHQRRKFLDGRDDETKQSRRRDDDWFALAWDNVVFHGRSLFQRNAVVVGCSQRRGTAATTPTTRSSQRYAATVQRKSHNHNYHLDSHVRFLQQQPQSTPTRRTQRRPLHAAVTETAEDDVNNDDDDDHPMQSQNSTTKPQSQISTITTTSATTTPTRARVASASSTLKAVSPKAALGTSSVTKAVLKKTNHRRTRQQQQQQKENQQQPTPPKIPWRVRTMSSTSNAAAAAAFTRLSLMEHDILTVEQEQQLGRALQRALKLQERVQEHLRLHHQQHQQQQEWKSPVTERETTAETSRRILEKANTKRKKTKLSQPQQPWISESRKRRSPQKTKAVLSVEGTLRTLYPELRIYNGRGERDRFESISKHYYNDDDDDELVEYHEQDDMEYLTVLKREQLRELDDQNKKILLLERVGNNDEDTYGDYYYFNQVSGEFNIASPHDRLRKRRRTINNERRRRSSVTTPLFSDRADFDAWAMSDNDDDKEEDMEQFQLTDADVNRDFGLLGGLAELQSVLLQGAFARDTLIRNNVRLVVSIAKKWAKQQYRSRGKDAADGQQGGVATLRSIYKGSWDRPSLDEAIQEGIMGLAEAADRFEPERNWKFGTYATFWVTNYIRRCFQSAYTNGIRAPDEFHQVRRKFNALVKSYCETGRPVPPIHELAQELEMTSVARLQTMLRVTQPHRSIDAPLYPNMRTFPGKAGSSDVGDGEVLLADLLEDDDPLAAAEDQVELSFLRQNLENALASELVPFERDVVRLRLGLDDGHARTVPQIVQEYHGALSPGEVRLAESRAYKKLRSPRSLSTYKLLSYLDFAGIDRADALLR